LATVPAEGILLSLYKTVPLAVIMKPLFTIFLLFVSFHAFNQNKIEFGAIRADSSFKAKHRTSYVDSLNFGIGNILNSNNELEIRLMTAVLPHAGYDIIILTYNNGTWDARKFLFEHSHYYPTTSVTYIQIDSNKKTIIDNYFESAFDTLKQNKIFLLPNMRELKYDKEIFDGTAFALSFKVKDQFREYFFDNPGQYAELNPNITEFKQFDRIVKEIRSLF
jgi:hypothetical protein